eukprot:Awhi_evm2s5989
MLYPNQASGSHVFHAHKPPPPSQQMQARPLEYQYENYSPAFYKNDSNSNDLGAVKNKKKVGLQDMKGSGVNEKVGANPAIVKKKRVPRQGVKKVVKSTKKMKINGIGTKRNYSLDSSHEFEGKAKIDSKLPESTVVGKFQSYRHPNPNHPPPHSQQPYQQHHFRYEVDNSNSNSNNSNSKQGDYQYYYPFNVMPQNPQHPSSSQMNAPPMKKEQEKDDSEKTDGGPDSRPKSPYFDSVATTENQRDYRKPYSAPSYSSHLPYSHSKPHPHPQYSSYSQPPPQPSSEYNYPPSSHFSKPSWPLYSGGPPPVYPPNYNNEEMNMAKAKKKIGTTADHFYETYSADRRPVDINSTYYYSNNSNYGNFQAGPLPNWSEDERKVIDALVALTVAEEPSYLPSSDVHGEEFKSPALPLEGPVEKSPTLSPKPAK